ncbi:hypothetical protein SAY86_021465 [Trapa natans]|uniref:Ninja-family protein n=1 Tax=Trapa natans TaxID=22666 RepID=A0AAN7MZ60_TRANT|nr:hypothetical protein SAY86_021465 [Trapa natans]
MAKAVEDCNPDTGRCIPMQMPGLLGNLSQDFISRTNFPQKSEDKVDGEGEVDLSLGLSLNGHFGVDPRANKFVRLSSIPEFMKPLSENRSMMTTASTPITRACSLPMENEEECKKRKAMQSLRRMEAKRKRTEKQRNSRAINCQNGPVVSEDRPDKDHGKDQFRNGSLDNSARKEADFGISNRGYGIKEADPEGKNDNNDLAVSQGSGISGLSEYEGLSVKGSYKCAELKSLSTAQSLSDNDRSSASTATATATAQQGCSNNSSAPMVGTVCNELPISGNGLNGAYGNVFQNMPSVSTRGDGPHGKKIDGFLYRYKKGEEVKIVCMCHWIFLSPAEFVKHAGGGDVSHPLRHIVVNASPFSRC